MNSILNELSPLAILPPLGPGSPNDVLRPQLQKLSVASLFRGQKTVDDAAASCCLSALWLLNDFLDESHALTQEIETPDGSYWHGIMHRREPDYGNAKYWFRRVGKHPVFGPLNVSATGLAQAEGERLDPACRFLATQSTWDPYKFIDLCETIARAPAGHQQAELLARRIARTEWDLLFEHCYRKAVGIA